MANAKGKPIRITRSARKGRAVSKSTLAAHSALSAGWASKVRQTVEVCDEQGNVTDTFDALIVDPSTVGKPADYTGLPGLISQWAKANGHAVRVHKVSDNTFAIRAK